jgi:hypothetical protein
MASELQQMIVIILGRVPNRPDPKETAAAERLIRVRHVTLPRASELMEFVIDRPDLREKINSVRAFELSLKELNEAYETERQAKLQKQRPVPKSLGELEVLEQIGRRDGQSAGDRIEWLRNSIAELRRSGITGQEYRARLKELLQMLHGERKDAA